jgi:hypothetical protein
MQQEAEENEAQLQTDTEVLDRPLLDYENDQHLLDSDDDAEDQTQEHQWHVLHLEAAADYLDLSVGRFWRGLAWRRCLWGC